MPETSHAKHKKADHYDDPNQNYVKYWNGRDYENAAEEMAIRRLLDGKQFKLAVDVGGGYGRLALLLENYADKVVLTDPSQRQLDLGKDLRNGHKRIEAKIMQADDLKFADNSIDLLTMIRVMHHLPDPAAEFAEISRVLAADGRAIIEVANYLHFRNRLKHIARGKRFGDEPVDIRSKIHREDMEMVAFVNHNPKTVQKQLLDAGLKTERILSVSNLRSPGLKKVMPKSAMLAVEGILQPRLTKLYFGPSIFFLVKKAS